jgi:hypothetical protein
MSSSVGTCIARRGPAYRRTSRSTAKLICVQATPQFSRRLKVPTFRVHVLVSRSSDPRLVPWVARFFMRMKFWRGTGAGFALLSRTVELLNRTPRLFNILLFSDVVAIKHRARDMAGDIHNALLFETGIAHIAHGRVAAVA